MYFLQYLSSLIHSVLYRLTVDHHVGDISLYFWCQGTLLLVIVLLLHVLCLQIVHLKRFQFVGGKWVKSQKVVNFPFDHFNPTSYLAAVPKQTVIRHHQLKAEMALKESSQNDMSVVFLFTLNCRQSKHLVRYCKCFMCALLQKYK